MMQRAKKDQSIHDVVERLERRFGPRSLSVVDHWDADLMAIGVHRSGVLQPLVYICTNMRPVGQYYAEIELPSDDSGQPYKQGPRFESLDFEELVGIVASSLGLQQALLPDRR